MKAARSLSAAALLLLSPLAGAFLTPAPLLLSPKSAQPLPYRSHHTASLQNPHYSRIAPLGAPRARALPRTAPRMQTAAARPESEAMGVLREGIKSVGVGVKGSKPIPAELVAPLSEIVAGLAKGEVKAEWEGEEGEMRQRAASFLGTLFVKVSLLDTDEDLLSRVAALSPPLASQGLVRGGCSSAQLLSAAVGERGSGALRALALKLLDGESLSEGDAHALGRCLFDKDDCVDLQVLCMHLLRVRYETPDEWRGLLRAQQETVGGAGKAGGGKRVVQIADPFDGTHKSDAFSPLIAKHLQERWHVVAVGQCGLSSGPKYGPNLRDISVSLGEGDAPFVGGGKADFGGEAPLFGWYADQSDVSGALDRWVSLRRNIIKRPFLATSEKFVNPFGAEILLASAFHPSFGEKMFDMAETASEFKACVIVRKGTEGSTSMSLSRNAEFLVGVRRDGVSSMDRYHFEFGPSDLGMDTVPEKDQQYEITTDTVVAKIKAHAEKGSSGDEMFDKRVKVTCAAMDVAMAFIDKGEKLKEEVKSS